MSATAISPETATVSTALTVNGTKTTSKIVP
jgi:hypothetical protein